MEITPQMRVATLAAVERLLDNPYSGPPPGQLRGLVQAVVERRQEYLNAAARYGTPQYLLELGRVEAGAARFAAAFAAPGRTTRVHYAFKANPTLPLVRALQQAGLSADASSGLELELALRCGFDHIVLSGPAKTDEELNLALAHPERVTVHLDSFAEWERLEALAARRGVDVEAGIRLNTQGHGLWTKFGIPLNALPELVARARPGSRVRLRGVQFHLSWNRSAVGYLQTLAEFGPVLAAHRPAAGWAFIDIGGGYYPEDDEAVYPWMTPVGRLLGLLGQWPADGPPPAWDGNYLVPPVQPIEAMAAQINEAFATHIERPLGPVALWLEPGRYLANPTTQLLLRVADVKAPDVAITDGGTNLLGWERLELEHCPLINLTRPASTPRPGKVYGSLCTPHDLWGFTCYGADLQVGDILMLPAQGAYVQTLAQRFIKPLCQTVVMAADGTLSRARPAEAFGERYPELAGIASPDER
jgi:diaminopimelate decarboxylase